MSKIERAIEYFEDDSEMQCLWEHHNTPDLALDCIALALDTLKEKLEREQNKPLTVQQLKTMIGEPIYMVMTDEYFLKKLKNSDVCLNHWIILSNDKIIEYEKYGGFELYKYKPKNA